MTLEFCKKCGCMLELDEQTGAMICPGCGGTNAPEEEVEEAASEQVSAEDSTEQSRSDEPSVADSAATSDPGSEQAEESEKVKKKKEKKERPKKEKKPKAPLKERLAPLGNVLNFVGRNAFLISIFATICNVLFAFIDFNDGLRTGAHAFIAVQSAVSALQIMLLVASRNGYLQSKNKSLRAVLNVSILVISIAFILLTLIESRQPVSIYLLYLYPIFCTAFIAMLLTGTGTHRKYPYVPGATMIPLCLVISIVLIRFLPDALTVTVSSSVLQCLIANLFLAAIAFRDHEAYTSRFSGDPHEMVYYTEHIENNGEWGIMHLIEAAADIAVLLFL